MNKYGCALLCTILLATLPTITWGSRDPTRPATHFKMAGQANYNKYGLLLTSIIHGKTRKVATINGESLVENEKIGDYVILQIEAHHVILKRVGSKEKITLPISQGLAVTPVKLK
jgi:hypothetical protein